MPEYLPHLFESFSRERNSSESGIIGTGLGLPIVKSLVDMMGGTIRVDSGLGKGTRFEIILCHKIAEEKTKRPEHLDEEKEAEKFLEGKQVLLVEDNELNAEIAKTILEDNKMKVEVATDGEVALKCIKRVPADYYDLVLMDIQMPRMNGHVAKPIEIGKLMKTLAGILR
ncbi:response regulator [Dorea sp.]